jgi:hypothetical protein
MSCSLPTPERLDCRRTLPPTCAQTQPHLYAFSGALLWALCARFRTSEAAAGYGLIKIAPSNMGSKARRLSEFDPASLLKPASPKTRRAKK